MLPGTGRALACVVLMCAAVAGCSPANGDSSMPWHGLDMTGISKPSAPRNASSWATAPAGEGGWAVSGARPWRYIVIHHSASEKGNAASIDEYHRQHNGWDSLGYHFVIDNGNGAPDGFVEVGPRWKAQKWGAHTGGTPNNEYNNYGIGICLIGDFGGHAPSAAQEASLRGLVSYLCAKYDIGPENVIGHRDAPGAHTECPGDGLYRWVYASLRPQLAKRYAAR